MAAESNRKLRRLRIWGIKDGRRVYVDQQGPELFLDPEIPELRASLNLKWAALRYLDKVVDIWTGNWRTDQELQELADAWNKGKASVKYTVATMRENELQDFEGQNLLPPGSWESIEEVLGKSFKSSYFRRGQEVPADAPLCRECLQPCEWIWHECFPGHLCGSAGWVAICRPCKSWYKELTLVIS